jgi:uncharacterized membrane protein YgaE (UPF0421/DUF939 family)
LQASSAFSRFTSKTNFLSTTLEPKKLDWSRENAFTQKRGKIRKRRNKKKPDHQKEQGKNAYMKELTKRSRPGRKALPRRGQLRETVGGIKF